MSAEKFFGSPEATSPSWLNGFNDDLSRMAWNDATASRQLIIGAPETAASRDLAPLIIEDKDGHVTSVDKPDRTSFEYSKFNANGQPTEIKMTSASGTVEQWRKEADNLWRQCDPKDGHPYYRVLRGEYTVGKDGTLYVSGQEGYMAVPGEKKGPYGAYPVKDAVPSPAIRDLAPMVLTDSQGRVTSVDQPDGTKYDFSKFDANGQPQVIKITGKDGDYGYWKKEGDHFWRSYNREKPDYQVLKGDWVVDRDGKMHSSGDFDTAPLPKRTAADASKLPAKAPADGVTPSPKAHADKSAPPPHTPADSPKPAPKAPADSTKPPVSGVVELGSAHDDRVKPGPGGIVGHPPEGCKALTGPVPKAVALEARKLLSGDWGTETAFTYDGKLYVARVEPHAPDKGIDHWHKGVSVFEAIDQSRKGI